MCGGDDELDFLMFIVFVILSIKGKVWYVIDKKFYETGSWIGNRNCWLIGQMHSILTPHSHVAPAVGRIKIYMTLLAKIW